MKKTSLAALIWLALAGLSHSPSHAAGSPIGHALGDLTQRLEQNPRDAGLLNDYGNLLVHAGFLEEAEMAYRSALEVAPDSLPAHYNLGLLELELGHAQAARRQFRRAIKLDSSFGRAHYGLGSTYVAAERNRRAVKHYATAFLLDPGLLEVTRNPEILFNKLTTWAAMHSYLTSSPGRSGRLYEDPRPIVGLLIPGIEELLDRVAEPTQPEGTEAPGSRPEDEDTGPELEAEPAEEAEGDQAAG
jgi:tetratricopeptide (TPR) repeat protein